MGFVHSLSDHKIFLGGDCTSLKNFRYFLWACSPGKYTTQVHFRTLELHRVNDARKLQLRSRPGDTGKLHRLTWSLIYLLGKWNKLSSEHFCDFTASHWPHWLLSAITECISAMPKVTTKWYENKCFLFKASIASLHWMITLVGLDRTVTSIFKSDPRPHFRT